MICGALLNQASGFIRLKNFAEAEARCSRVLACTTPSDGVKITGGATARARALHFRGFSRQVNGFLLFCKHADIAKVVLGHTI